MRAPDPLDGLIRLIRSHIRIERKTRFKTIQVDVVPTIARDHHMRVLPTLSLPGFGTSVRTVPVRHAAPSSFLAYYPVTQPVPGTSLSPSIRSRIAANNLRGTATSAIWNVTAQHWRNSGHVAMVEPTSERNEEGGIAV